jgi:hypothetical protein
VISGGGDGGAPAGGKPPLNKINLLRHPRRPAPAGPRRQKRTHQPQRWVVCMLNSLLRRCRLHHSPTVVEWEIGPYIRSCFLLVSPSS